MQHWTIDTISLDSVDSTNLYAKAHGKEFSKDHITCITAEHQTAGRGRFDRKWISPRGVNLYATFYFHLPKTTQNVTALACVMAESLAALLEKEGLKPTIKWPNDVQLSGKKTAGVLCEVVFHEHSVEVILGIGVNLNMKREDLDRIDQPATSLKEETHREWDKALFLKKLQVQFLQHLQKFCKGGQCTGS